MTLVYDIARQCDTEAQTFVKDHSSCVEGLAKSASSKCLLRLATTTTTASIPARTDLSIRLAGLLHQLQVCFRGVVDKDVSRWG